jgi:type III pantothenate kinase
LGVVWAGPGDRPGAVADARLAAGTAGRRAAQSGADRIANACRGRAYYADVIVVDFGTATFDCITADARFLGGVIMPGLRTAADQLTRRAAKLPATELRAPPRVIGRRTEECIQAGVLYGAADAVDGIVRRIRAEWPGEGCPHAIATGGLAHIVAPLTASIEQVHPDLTLQGLRIAARHLGLCW